MRFHDYGLALDARVRRNDFRVVFSPLLPFLLGRGLKSKGKLSPSQPARLDESFANSKIYSWPMVERCCYLFITFCWYIKLFVVILRWRIIVVGTELFQVLRLAHLLSRRFQRLELNRNVLQVSAAHYLFRQAHTLELRCDVPEPEILSTFPNCARTSSRAPLKSWNGFRKNIYESSSTWMQTSLPPITKVNEFQLQWAGKYIPIGWRDVEAPTIKSGSMRAFEVIFTVNCDCFQLQVEISIILNFSKACAEDLFNNPTLQLNRKLPSLTH